MAVGAFLVLAVAPATALAVDLKGTVTVRETITDPWDLGYAKDVTVRWTMSDRRLDSNGGARFAAARPEVLGYSERGVRSTGDGEPPLCTSTRFSGFTQPGEAGLVQFFMLAQDRIRRVSRASVRVSERQPYARMTVSDCDGSNAYERPTALVDDVGYTVRPTVIGQGDWKTMPSTYYLSPTPDRVRMRRGADGRWRAKGTEVRSGAWGYEGTRKITVSWNLSSKKPSSDCRPPSQRALRGLTVAQAKRILRKAGLRYEGRLLDWTKSSVPRDRVTGILGADGSGRRCGSRVTLWVKR